MSANSGELVITFTPATENRRRVRYKPIEADPHAYERIEEEQTPTGWRRCGRSEVVYDVDVEDNRSGVRAYLGP